MNKFNIGNVVQSIPNYVIMPSIKRGVVVGVPPEYPYYLIRILEENGDLASVVVQGKLVDKHWVSAGDSLELVALAHMGS